MDAKRRLDKKQLQLLLTVRYAAVLAGADKARFDVPEWYDDLNIEDPASRPTRRADPYDVV